jgi:hypothetical protein
MHQIAQPEAGSEVSDAAPNVAAGNTPQASVDLRLRRPVSDRSTTGSWNSTALAALTPKTGSVTTSQPAT